MNFALALVLSLLSGIVIMFGGWVFTFRKNWDRKYLDFFIALGAGYILAVALLDMIPAAGDTLYVTMLMVAAGYLTVHLFEHVFTSHFHFGEETHEHLVSRLVSTSALIGLMVHNFFSGVAIASGMMSGVKLGGTVFAGTVLHKLPEGFTITSIMFASHHRRNLGLLATVLLAVSSVLGTLVVYGLETEALPVKNVALALSAGTFIHVSTTDLIPRVNDSESRWMPLVVFLGVVLFLVSSALIHH
jgi:ZIP family zinc transporter/zinc and cadmium transporter